MTRGTRFSEKVVAFVLTERSRGKRWNDIINAVRETFDIQPPTERQMRNWYREYGGVSISTEKLLRESLIKVARNTAPLVAFATQQVAVEQGIPALAEAFQRNKDPRIVGGVLILSMLEQTVGDKFDEVIRIYQEIKEGTRQ